MTTESESLRMRRRLTARLDELPSLPTVVARLMTLDPEAEGAFEELLSAIESDPGLSARLLARANSVHGGSMLPVTTLRHALTRIGSHEAADLVLALAVTSVFVPRDDWEKSLWRHAIQVATAARELARRCADDDVDPDEAYAAGLLHDIGRFVLFQEAPDRLRRIDEGGWDNPRDLLEEERRICGLTHAELGARACRHWGLPDSIAEIVLHHHERPRGPLEGQVAKLTALIRLADLAMFPSVIPGTPGLKDAPDDVLRVKLQSRFPPFLRLDVTAIRGLLADVETRSQRSVEALGLD